MRTLLWTLGVLLVAGLAWAGTYTYELSQEEEAAIQMRVDQLNAERAAANEKRMAVGKPPIPLLTVKEFRDAALTSALREWKRNERKRQERKLVQRLMQLPPEERRRLLGN